jgi:magnesium transporter
MTMMSCRSAALAHLLLNEKLNIFGILGCALCINGSLVIALHAPPERPLTSVMEIWELALQPGGALIMARCCVVVLTPCVVHSGFLAYTLLAFTAVVFLILYVAPQQGSSNIFVYISICSIAGSLSVISCKVRCRLVVQLRVRSMN